MERILTFGHNCWKLVVEHISIKTAWLISKPIGYGHQRIWVSPSFILQCTASLVWIIESYLQTKWNWQSLASAARSRVRHFWDHQQRTNLRCGFNTMELSERIIPHIFRIVCSPNSLDLTSPHRLLWAYIKGRVHPNLFPQKFNKPNLGKNMYCSWPILTRIYTNQ